MFGKKENKEMKIVESDVGLAEDTFEFLKHAVADESHCLGNYNSMEDEKYLLDLEEARSLRTGVLDEFSKQLNAQKWCRIKHICGKAMTAQEICTRYLSVGNMEMAKKYADRHKKLYIQFIKILGFTKENISNESSA